MDNLAVKHGYYYEVDRNDEEKYMHVIIGKAYRNDDVESFTIKSENGFLAFYICVGIPSLISAWTNGWKKGHQNYWTEGWANELAMQYFGVQQWPIYRFPPKSPSKKTLRWIKWGI